MAQTILHKANSRGHANHGWLNSYHSFSFAHYYDPSRMNFGVLRVLNDDTVAPGIGFGAHPHNNMEIISIPLEGDLQHKDSMGNVQVIKQGDIQVLSAGTGIQHSEMNKNKDQEVKFLQIWLFPNRKNVQPRYDQLSLDQSKMKNEFLQILSPFADDDGVWIHQNAWFHMAELDKGLSKEYNFKSDKNGLYVFLLEGSMEVDGQQLAQRDGLGIWDTNKVKFTSLSEDAKVLLMEVPMEIEA
jgi:redox-sensitive bicupin YhaK (pirin superfamily)